MFACFGGWSLDAFDVQMYSFVIPTVIGLWGLSRGEAGLIGTVTLLISSFGGWFSGTLADRFGRVRMLQITILWYSVFTFFCAFAQNFEQLFILRALQGFGFGGEWAVGAVLDGRGHPRQIPRRAASALCRPAGRSAGAASALVYTAWSIGSLPEAMAWPRAVRHRPLPGGSSWFWIRRHIDEPEILHQPSSAGAKVRHLAPLLGVPRRASVDHDQGVDDGRWCAGQRLCDRHLDADLSAQRVRHLSADRDRRLPDGADPRRIGAAF